MPWYALQTYTGKEEQLVTMVRKQVPQECYGECFVAYFEQIRDRKQENQIHILRLFPGYIFVSCDEVGSLFRQLKMVPAMTKIMTTGAFAFTPLYEGEMEHLQQMMDDDHVVRLTYLATDGKDHVSCMSGPLELCRDRIVSYQFRKRYAVVRLTIGGQPKDVRAGIILNDDVRREIAYGKVEANVPKPERYEIPTRGDAGEHFEPGDQVVVVDGAFEGSVATVSQAGNGQVKIAVQMFERELQVDLPIESVRKVDEAKQSTRMSIATGHHYG